MTSLAIQAGGSPPPPSRQGSPAELGRVAQIAKVVAQAKRGLLNHEKETRFQGKKLVREVVYVTSDVGTAGFSLVQGVSLFASASQGLMLFGSISGLAGGILNIGQGLFLLGEALQFYKNGQREQFLRILADALLLIGVGLFMTLASLSMLGVKMGALAGVAAVAANPYAMPALLLLLVLPGLIQTIKYMTGVCQGKDLGAQLPLGSAEESRHLDVLKDLGNSLDREVVEQVSEMIEEFSDQIGVEAAIEAVDLLGMFLEGDEEAIARQQEAVRTAIRKWNRVVKLRIAQLALYSATSPLGLTSALVRGAGKVIECVSKFSLMIPSSIGAGLDWSEPFKRNGAIAVRKVEFSDVEHLLPKERAAV